MAKRKLTEITETEKKLSLQCTKTTIWIIKSFRTMIENKWKMTIYERDEDGGEGIMKAIEIARTRRRTWRKL